MISFALSVRDERGKWDRIMAAAVAAADDLVAAVGVHSGKIAQYAAINEFGAPAANIPSRPFLRSTFDMNVARLEAYARKGAEMIVMGEATQKQILTRMGIMLRNEIIKAITDSSRWEPNKPSTVDSKKSSGPLRDTGGLLQAITFLVDMQSKFEGEGR